MKLQGVGVAEYEKYGMRDLSPSQLADFAGNSLLGTSIIFLARQVIFTGRLTGLGILIQFYWSTDLGILMFVNAPLQLCCLGFPLRFASLRS